MNGDGYCDWYLNVSVPMSAGGDRDSINTLYLGGPRGWSRTGATMPADKPDELGYGKSDQEQPQYLFGEKLAVIHDAAFYNRNVQRDGRPGYRIFDWNADKKTLRLLDKWMPGSKAAEVYAHFKVHGARIPSKETAAAGDTIQSFDPEVEEYELEQACDSQSMLRSFPESNGIVSRYLLAGCKH